MFGARKLIFELGHFLFGAVQHAAEFVRDPQSGGATVDFRAMLQLRTQPFLQLINICPNLLQERPRYAIALTQKSRKKMFVRNFGIVQLRREVLCRLQRLLHLLRVSVDAHGSKYQTAFSRQLSLKLTSVGRFLWALSFASLHTKVFDTNASTTMSVCDERAGKGGWIEVAGTFAAGAVSAVYHRFAHFRQWHVDANDGPKLGHERAHYQGDFAWAGELRCGVAGFDTCSSGRFIG